MLRKLAYILLLATVIWSFGLYQVKKITAQSYDAPNHDLNTVANFDFRIDGYAPLMYVGNRGVKLADVDNDGKKDVIIDGKASTQSRSGNGAVWVIYASLLETLTSTKILDLSNPAHYNLRFDGAATDDYLGNSSGGTMFGDINGNGETDLVIPDWQTAINGAESGSVYYIDDSIIDNYSGTGNNIDLNTTTNFTTRYDGAAIADRLSQQGTRVDDVNNNGVDDILISSLNTDYHGLTNAGSLYVISDALVAAKKVTDTGNIVTITDATSWWLRVDGAANGDVLCTDGNIAVADWGGNSKNDLAVGSMFADSFHGQIWLINDSLLDDYVGNGNTLDLADTTKYSTLIGTTLADSILFLSKDAATDYNNDGVKDMVITGDDFLVPVGSGTAIVGSDILAANSGPGDSIDINSPADFSVRFTDLVSGGVFADFNGDGLDDMITVEAYFSSLTREQNGAAFIVYNEIFNLPGLGNSLSVMDNLRHYSVRYDGPHTDANLGISFGFDLGDVNGDATNDVALSSTQTWYNGDAYDDTGSVWLIMNFPHTTTLSSVTQSGGSTVVHGTINAVNSVTNIAGANGRIAGSNNWFACVADDGAFDSKVEDVTCTIGEVSDLNQVEVRAFDVNYSFSDTPGVGTTQNSVAGLTVLPETGADL